MVGVRPEDSDRVIEPSKCRYDPTKDADVLCASDGGHQGSACVTRVQAQAINKMWYGPTTDKVITNAMFLVIIFFPTVIVVFSVIQWRLDRRKHARMDAAKRRAANVDWRGGW